ncbi:hypothetical protein [Phyllobacterium zundukense]|uniref:Uncharacterized protein n=1 Tax=Phyllobacterium zundukense TaxID=1867719 RepID=A0A2N9W0K8_9HYPH|nr:hypothetical protein [Phyllobacterium zundukense]ATU95474.1 hypothetical protein BLM14_27740 [Phyllobacterium zundukense]PIO45276.1 hypothetical protein B5P45_08445 [Phyllobacterium zundukense]
MPLSTNINPTSTEFRANAEAIRRTGWLTVDFGMPSRTPACVNLPASAIFAYVVHCGLALSGHGRFTPKQRGAQGVFLQFIDPSFFSGREAFLQETTDFVRQCKESRAAEGSRASGCQASGRWLKRLAN